MGSHVGGTMKDDNGKARSTVKAPYETPTLTVHGTFESVTQHSSSGRHFDMSFNAGDPVPDPLDIFS
jgi:hypothetical protein